MSAVARAALRHLPVEARPGVSIKLSALHPRFEVAQHARVATELAPRLAMLAQRAAVAGIPITIDAEESERLELTLELFAGLARDPRLADWSGLGLAVQAYQRRAIHVCDWLVALAGGDRPATDGASRQGRVLGHRDQGRADARPRRLSGVHAQGRHRRVLSLPARRRLLAAGAATVSAVRDAQLPHGRHVLECASRTPRFRVPEAARDGRRRCTNALVPEHRGCRAAYTRRSEATAICSPTSCAGCSRTVPTPRSSTRCGRTRSPLSGSSPIPLTQLPAPTACRTRAFRCRAISIRAGATRAASICRTARARSRARWRRAPLPTGRHADAGGDRRRRAAADLDARVRRCRARPGATGPATPAEAPRALPRARRRRAGGRHATELVSLCVARGGQDARPTRSPKCARRWTSAATTPPRAQRVRGAGDAAGAGRASRTGSSLAGRGVFACISPWNFPLAIFTGQVAGALARRQRGDRQARRADAARSARARPRSCTRPAYRARCSASWSAPARRSAHRSCGIRRSTAWRSPAPYETATRDQPRTGRARRADRPAHRRDRRHQRADRRFARRCRSRSLPTPSPPRSRAPGSAVRRAPAAGCRRMPRRASSRCSRRHGRARRRRSRAAGDRRRPGHRRARQARAGCAHRASAVARPADRASAASRGCGGKLRRADRVRDRRWSELPRARGVRAASCTSCAGVRRSGPSARRGRRDRLRPHAGDPQPHRALRRDVCACDCASATPT